MKDSCQCPSRRSIAEIVRRYDAEAALFSERVSRLGLLTLDLPQPEDACATINVWRNHAFEPLLPLMEPYCSFGGWRAVFRMGGYDDTLLFADHKSADVELLWVDSDRFRANAGFGDVLQWLEMRMKALRAASHAPIVLAAWVETQEEAEAASALVNRIPACYFADLGAACTQAGERLLDPRSATLAGTPIAKRAQTILARKLACHWLPAVHMAPIKAIALDLDHTLHEGVLGEDGTRGVRLTPGHAALQQYLRSLAASGIYLALVSRNERVDAEALFAERLDYPLRWEDFSVVEVSWEGKTSALERIAQALRIAPDSILFVDDNPGELVEVALNVPGVHTVPARPDAFVTQRAIEHYPGIWRWKREREDSHRAQDLRANTDREALAEAVSSPEEYFRSLQVNLEYCHRASDQVSRIADLCRKTNQFNLALRRLNQVEITDFLNSDNAAVTTVRLSDRFSDSGVIAVVIASRKGERMIVEELCISCRALGRRLEDTIVILALRGMPIFEGCREIVFRAQRGPRNQPAIEWLARLTGRAKLLESGDQIVSASLFREFVADPGITVEEETGVIHGSPAD